jgi:hypothetical protein
MTATVFKYLSYLGLALGVVLSFWVLRWGALCFLFSIACAHLAGTARADRHAAQIHETLFIVLSILGQVNRKLDESRADTPRDQPAAAPANDQRLPPGEARSGIQGPSR